MYGRLGKERIGKTRRKRQCYYLGFSVMFLVFLFYTLKPQSLDPRSYNVKQLGMGRVIVGDLRLVCSSAMIPHLRCHP